MIYLYWVAIFLGMALGLSVRYGRRIEQTFAPALFVGILVMYLFGVIGPLSWGLVAVSGLGMAGAVYAVVQMIRRRRLFLHHWATPGGLVLLAAVVYIAWMQAGRLAIGNDEFSHWAYTVKVMDHYDQLSIWHAQELIFPEYPPALALLEYLFVRLTPNFTEGYLYRAMALFQVSLLLPVLAQFNWKKLTGALVGFAGLFLLPLAFYGQFYSDLCVDGTLALLFAYLLYTWVSNRHLQGFVQLSLGLGMAVLVLTKESGMVFALVALALIAWDAMYAARGNTMGNECKKTALRLGLLLLTTAAAKISWSVLVAMQGLSGGGSGNLVQRAASLFAPWPEKWSLTLANFWEHLFLPTKNESVLPLSLLAWFVLGLVLLRAMRQWLPMLNGTLKRLNKGLFAGFVVYCIGLLYLYFFQFSEYEAINVASLERYLSSWLLGVVLLGAMVVLTACARDTAGNWMGCGCVLLAALLVMPGTQTEISRLVSPGKVAAVEQQQRSAYFTPHTFPFAWSENDQIYFVAEDTAVYEELCAKYSFYPNRISSSLGYNFNTAGDYALWSNEVSADAWQEVLSEDYTYVYLYKISPSFIEKYASLFEDAGDIVGGALYAVDKIGQTVQLHRVWPTLTEA